MPSWKQRVILSIVLLAVIMSLGSFSISNNQQLSVMGGMAEEYFNLGFNLLHSGMLTADNNNPCLFRPPGYPFFIASVLSFRHGIGPHATAKADAPLENERGTFDDIKAVYLAQCVLLALSAVILFLWMSAHLQLRDAFIAALLFGCNPYMLILTGLLHYDILHIFLIILSSWILYLALTASGWKQVFILIFSGVLWGLCTLVRPVTLILPAFVLVGFLILFRRSLWLALRNFVVFTAAMVITIAPYTFRNYLLTDRFIPVNAQAKVALWSATVRPPQPSPNYFRWWNLWYDEGMDIYSRVTGSSTYSYDEYTRNIIPLEDAFAKEAALNLRNQPGVYVGNVLRNFRSILLDINSVIIKVFQFIQQPGAAVEKKWFGLGYPQDFYPSYATTIFESLMAILSVFGFLGVCIALLKKDSSLAVPGIVFLCLCLAHCATVLDMTHYYVKIPFLFIFAGYFTSALSQYRFNIPSLRLKLNPAYIAYALMLGLTITLITVIQFKLPPSVAPSAVTAGKHAAASNFYRYNPQFGPAQAVDNNALTRWATDTSLKQAWLAIDLNEPTIFSQVRISELYGRIRRFELQVRENNTWKTFIDDGRIGCDYRRQFEPVIARYVRLNILDATAGPTISEFQLFTGQWPLNAGCFASASNIFENNPAFGPDKAVDCNGLTRWATDSGTKQARLEIDLGGPATFNQARITEKYDRIRHFNLQVKENDSWRTIVIGDRMGSDYYAFFMPVTARYIRLNITDSSAPPTICELQLFEN